MKYIKFSQLQNFNVYIIVYFTLGSNVYIIVYLHLSVRFGRNFYEIRTSFVSFSISVPAGYPQNFSATVTSTRSVHLTWSSVLPSERNGIISGYIINVTAAERAEKMQLQSQYKNITLNAYPYTTYTFIIAATTIAGVGPFSTVVTTRTPPDGNF